MSSTAQAIYNEAWDSYEVVTDLQAGGYIPDTEGNDLADSLKRIAALALDLGAMPT